MKMKYKWFHFKCSFYSHSTSTCFRVCQSRMVLKNTVWGLNEFKKSLFLSLALLGQQLLVNVGQHTSGGNGDSSEQTVELLVVAHGQLDVAGDDARALVIAGSVSGQLENLGGQVLEHGGQVHGGTGSDAVGVAALTKVTVDASDGELQTGAAGARRRLSALSLSLASLG
jgi:hypothetical protein